MEIPHKAYEVSYLKVISLMLKYSPVVDVITGAMLLYGLSSSGISALYKGFIRILCIARLCRKTSRRTAIFLLAGAFLSVIALAGSGEAAANVSLLYDINLLIKLFTPIVLILTYKEMISTSPHQANKETKKIIQFYKVFFPLSIIVPKILGIGFSTYSYGSGFKGLYFAGNDISIVMAVVTTWNIDDCIKGMRKKDIVLAGASLLSLLLLGTKTSILMTVLGVMICLLKNKRINATLLVSLFAVLGILLAVTVFADELQLVLNSFKFFYKKNLYAGRNIVSFLLSQRDVTLKKAFAAAYQDNSIRTFLFGNGPYRQVVLGASDAGLIEMDLFDMFLWFGAPFSIYVCAFYSSYYRSCRLFANYLQKFCWLSVIAFSFMAGHVLFTPLANFMLAVLMIDMQAKKTEILAEKRTSNG